MSPVGAACTVLVADDDPDLLEMMTTVITAAGHRAVGARDGSIAIALASHLEVDIAVLDVMMPKATGLEVLAEIRSMPGPQPLVLMLSALCSRADVRAGYAAGADDYLAKPFTVSELVERITVLLDERQVAP